MELTEKDRANILIEALPYIQRWAGQTVVVKYGGNAMIDEKLKHSFALNIIMMRAVGLFPVVVHGGGPQIGELLKRLDISCEFIEGMRVTTPEVMNVVQMVLVGQVEKVNPAVLQSLEHGGFIPVIAPVGKGPDGESLNINADLVAGALAQGLRASKLVLLTDTPGVLDANGELITELTPAETKQLLEREVIKGGMIPKVNCGLAALEAGVERVHIIDGRVPNALLLEIFTDKGAGTLLKE